MASAKIPIEPCAIQKGETMKKAVRRMGFPESATEKIFKAKYNAHLKKEGCKSSKDVEHGHTIFLPTIQKSKVLIVIESTRLYLRALEFERKRINDLLGSISEDMDALLKVSDDVEEQAYQWKKKDYYYRLNIEKKYKECVASTKKVSMANLFSDCEKENKSLLQKAATMEKFTKTFKEHKRASIDVKMKTLKSLQQAILAVRSALDAKQAKMEAKAKELADYQSQTF